MLNEHGIYTNYQKLNPESSTIIPPQTFLDHHILDVIPPPYNKTAYITFRETIRSQSPQFTIIDLRVENHNSYSVFISMIPLTPGVLVLAKDFPHHKLHASQILLTIQDLQKQDPIFTRPEASLEFLKDSHYTFTFQYEQIDKHDQLNPILWLSLTTNMIHKLNLTLVHTTNSPASVTFKGKIHHAHELTTLLNLLSPTSHIDDDQKGKHEQKTQPDQDTT